MSNYDERFTRMEQQLDKLTDAVVTLARVEEKVRGINHRLGEQQNAQQALFLQMAEVKDELHEIRLKTYPQAEATKTWADRIGGGAFQIVSSVVLAVLLVKFGLS